MNPEKTLIDRAAEKCGSYVELARRIGTSKQALSQMKHGQREISPETAALLADIANEDARDAVIRAVIARNKTGPKAEQIREILGKALAAGVAAMLLFFYSGATTPTTAEAETIAPELTGLYIVSIGIVALLAWGTFWRKPRTWGLSPHTPTPPLRDKLSALGAHRLQKVNEQNGLPQWRDEPDHRSATSGLSASVVDCTRHGHALAGGLLAAAQIIITTHQIKAHRTRLARHGLQPEAIPAPA